MLVCNVSLRPPGRSIAAEVAEATTAADATASGGVVFATLVDDPASVGDFVDAYTGAIMLKAASAADDPDASLPGLYAGNIVEAATATDTQDGVLGGLTWNPSDVTAVTLSNGNLTCTGVSPGGTRATRGYTTGKYYWEYTVSVWVANNTVGALAPLASNLTTAAAGSAGAVMGCLKDGSCYINTSYQGNLFGARSAGQTFGIAVDFGSKLVWYRVAPSGNWNGSGTADPATGTGGLSFGSLSGAIYPAAIFNSLSDVITANFGGSTFSGTMPSGFSVPPP